MDQALKISAHAQIPIGDRPCCAKCRASMHPNWLKSKRGVSVLQWYCRPCRSSAMASRCAVTEQLAPGDYGWNIPRCIKHRCRMYQKIGTWGCYKCEKRGKGRIGPGRDLKYQTEFPLEVRPHCTKCRRQMTVVRQSGRSGYLWGWTCAKCKFGATTHTIRERLAVDVRPCCVPCRTPLNISGARHARRWKCSQCGSDFLARGVGYSGVKCATEKARIVAAATTEEKQAKYQERLNEISAKLAALVRENTGHPFNERLSTFQEQVLFHLKRTPARDRNAVAAAVDDYCSTPEEIAEVVPLTSEEIKAICLELVNSSPPRAGYEWRPIGKATPGRPEYGIFRKDAPVHLRPIISRPPPIDHYNVDRSGLAEAASIASLAARG